MLATAKRPAHLRCRTVKEVGVGQLVGGRVAARAVLAVQAVQVSVKHAVRRTPLVKVGESALRTSGLHPLCVRSWQASSSSGEAARCVKGTSGAPRHTSNARATRMAASAYGVLGLPDGAAPEAVRQAYKRVVLAAHPDRVRTALRRAALFTLVMAALMRRCGTGRHVRAVRPGASRVCNAIRRALAARAPERRVTRGAVSRRCVLTRGHADPKTRAAHDEALRASGGSGGGGGARAVTVHGQTCGRELSQRGVVRGVTVVTHGQTGPPPRPAAPAPAELEPPLTEAECAEREQAAARDALTAGDAALAAGDHAAAVAAYTRAVRTASAGGYAAAAAHAARADAHAAAGDWRRALTDAEEAAALEPAWSAAHERCGRAWAALGDDVEAARAFETAARLGDAAPQRDNMLQNA